MKFNQKFFLSLWFFWITISFLYLLSFEGAGVEGNWNHGINNILGFFTPMGLFNLAVSIDSSSKWIITIPLLFVVLFLGNYMGKKIISIPLRIVYNLYILILLTMLMDVIIWRHWLSLTNLIAIFR